MKSLVFYAPPRRVFFLLCLLTAATPLSWAWQACSEGGGICPAGDTCCATSTPGVSTCISGKAKERHLGVVVGDAGSCCLDDDDDDNNGSNNSSFATTGCGAGFQCAIENSSSTSTSSSSSSSSYRYCKHIDDEDDENPPRLPRYRLCSLPDKALKEVYGFPVAPYVANATEHQQEAPPLLFAYYSNMGPIDAGTDDNNDAVSSTSNKFATVKKVILVIHGSGRNADDYLCCMNAALPPVPGRTHNHINPSNSTILVIAPWFVAEADLPVNITTTTTTTTTASSSSSTTTRAEPLVWNHSGPIDHTWRYGADALNSNVSSYATVDAILDYIVAAMNHHDDESLRRFENLRDIIVIGHSAGGQYTQRWALLSNSTAFATATSAEGTTMMQIIKKPSIRVIVANPKAFAYLDNRRYFVEQEQQHQDGYVANNNSNSTNNGMMMDTITSMSFRIPDESSLKRCPDYDEWEWGFSKTRDGHDDFLPTPYKDRAIAAAASASSANGNGTYESGVQVLVERYGLQRHVVYLAGQLDVLMNGNYCQELMQGDDRRQRSFRFFKSLSEIYNTSKKHLHYRLVVHGVHHDHCLMFQSPEGQQAMFGSFFHNDDDRTTATTSTS